MDYEEVLCYYPPEVTRLLAIGSSSWIGILEDNQKILKYPKVIGKEWNSLILENRIYKALESNPRIVTCYGLDDRGLLLEYMHEGSIRSRIQNSDAFKNIGDAQKLKWCRQTAEAVSFIHQKNVIHCDLSTRNLLLNDNLDVKVCDFQGLYTDQEGVRHNGLALENTKSYLPRPGTYSDRKSDMFALGSAFYEIIIGHAPFPELDELDDEEEIERRFRDGQFPSTKDILCGEIILKLWRLQYEQCELCLDELLAFEKADAAPRTKRESI